MDRKSASLVGAISALTPLAADAAPATKTLAEIMTPTSYAELLQPIPNAAELLKQAATAEPEARVQPAQYWGDQYYYPNYNYYPRRRYYHHHHHHHHGYGGWGGGWGGWGGGWGGGPYYHHHHHHHHHHDYYWQPY